MGTSNSIVLESQCTEKLSVFSFNTSYSDHEGFANENSILCRTVVFPDLAPILGSAECKHHLINTQNLFIHSFSVTPVPGLWWIPGMPGMTHAWIEHQFIAARHAHTFLHRGNLPKSMFLVGWRKPGNLKEIHADTARTCETPRSSELTLGPWSQQSPRKTHYNIIL